MYLRRLTAIAIFLSILWGGFVSCATMVQATAFEHAQENCADYMFAQSSAAFSVQPAHGTLRPECCLMRHDPDQPNSIVPEIFNHAPALLPWPQGQLAEREARSVHLFKQTRAGPRSVDIGAVVKRE
ncbi:MAG: hypothetical protein WC641_01780 [Patescibacteria group bacterium]